MNVVSLFVMCVSIDSCVQDDDDDDADDDDDDSI